MHFEPEASIMNRATMTSQLYAIKLLSESLPKGWKVYVKEHPGQFGLNNRILFWYLRNIFCFRSETFYKTIWDMENVKLINLNEPSQKIIENAQAISTICGTVALEAVLKNKPLILFDSKSSIAGKLKNVFNVLERKDVENAMKTIVENPVVEYPDLSEVLSKYTFETENQEINYQPEKKEYLVDIFSYLLNNRSNNKTIDKEKI